MTTMLRWLLTGLVALSAMSCGAGDVDAPEGAPVSDCPRVDTYLQPLYALMDAGKLDALAAAVRDEVPEDARRDLVSTLLRLVRSFEPGTFGALAALFEDADDPVPPEGEGAGLQATLGAVVGWVAVDAPGAPYPAVLRTLRRTINSCEGSPILTVLRDALQDEALLRATVDLLGSDALGDALDGLAVEDQRGREALRLLLRNVLVAATSPDFDVRALTSLLDLLADTSTPPWSDLVGGIERVLAPGPSLDAVQGLLACLLDVDPGVALAGLLYDALTSDSLDLAGVVGLAPAEGPVIDPALAALLVQTLDFLAADPEARRALVAVFTEILRDDVAPAVLADVAELLRAEALDDVVALLAELAAGACGR